MTSSDSSALDAGDYSALICTHKRGVGLALFPSRDAVDSVSMAVSVLAEESSQLCETLNFGNPPSSAQLYENGRFFYAVCEGLTAENLSHLYKKLLHHAGLSDERVGQLCVVVGPGSFTGLRLGCAFANGLAFGRKRPLVALDQNMDIQVLNRLKAPLENVASTFWGQPSSDADDPFATFVSFGDLYVALRAWECGAGQLVDVLEPHYGREPTPVLKLKQQQGRMKL